MVEDALLNSGTRGLDAQRAPHTRRLCLPMFLMNHSRPCFFRRACGIVRRDKVATTDSIDLCVWALTGFALVAAGWQLARVFIR